MEICVAQGAPSDSDGKERACNAQDLGFNSYIRKIPWRKEWQPTPVFLPEESHGQRSHGISRQSSCDLQELDTTERLTHWELSSTL